MYGVYTQDCRSDQYMCVHAASVIDINDGNRSGEEQERTVVDRILTMFKTLTWPELSR